jgi:hypothetical protein
VRRKHGVKSVSLTIAAFTAAFRKVLFEGRKESNIPKSVVLFIPFPLPGHPDKLRNHLFKHKQVALLITNPIAIN